MTLPARRKIFHRKDQKGQHVVLSSRYLGSTDDRSRMRRACVGAAGGRGKEGCREGLKGSEELRTKGRWCGEPVWAREQKGYQGGSLGPLRA